MSKAATEPVDDGPSRTESTSNIGSENIYRAHLLAGAIAGVAEHAVMFPVDTIKTRMQALAHPGQRLHGLAMSQTVKAIIRREGIRGLYGGFWAVASTAGPVHAVYLLP